MEMVGNFCQILELGGTTIKGRRVVIKPIQGRTSWSDAQGQRPPGPLPLGPLSLGPLPLGPFKYDVQLLLFKLGLFKTLRAEVENERE